MATFRNLMLSFVILSSASSFADENLLGYVKGAETLPKGAWEIYQIVTSRDDKGKGSYHAIDTATEVERGITDRFTITAAIQMMSINTNGLVVDGYLPKDNSFGLRPSGYEFYGKYNFLSPAKDDFGLSVLWAFKNTWIDAHSGQDKEKYTYENYLLLQKYFLEGQMIWTGNLAIEASHSKRAQIANLDPSVDWPTQPEMEIETKIGTGLSYRFMPEWFVGGEALYETEYETEIGRERYTLFAGPSLHHGNEYWWATLTYFPQILGGGETYEGQPDNLHLIEKTKAETKLKVGFNF